MENQINPVSNELPVQALFQLRSASPAKAVDKKDGEIISSGTSLPKEDPPGLKIDAEELAKLQQKFEDTFSYRNTRLEFSVDSITKRTVFKIVDSKSDQVIKQIPPEEILAFAHQLVTFLDGRLVNEKA